MSHIFTQKDNDDQSHLSEFPDVEQQPEKRPELPGGEQALLVRQLVERVHELAHLHMTSLMIVVVMVMMVMMVMIVIMVIMTMMVMRVMMVMMVVLMIMTAVATWRSSSEGPWRSSRGRASSSSERRISNLDCMDLIRAPISWYHCSSVACYLQSYDCYPL